MTIAAKALYDYTARTEKELSFSKCDMLDVIDKTPDGNWWDGLHGSKRGYIPVKYVEITELTTTPIPPQRKSSMNKEHSQEEDDSDTVTTLKSLPILEEDIPKQEEITKPVTMETEETPKLEMTSPKHSPGESPKRKKPDIPVRSGAVSKLTQQFQQPTPPQPQPQPQQRVLVGPHKTHIRYPSADMNKGNQEGSAPPRSNSSGSKPPIKPPLAAPPIRPKPDKDTPPAVPFPLMPHDAHVSASPLQKAHLQGQVSKVQSVPVKKGGVFRSSGKRDRPPLPSKPQPPPKSTGAVQLQAELSAVTARRRKPEGGDAS